MYRKAFYKITIFIEPVEKNIIIKKSHNHYLRLKKMIFEFSHFEMCDCQINTINNKDYRNSWYTYQELRKLMIHYYQSNEFSTSSMKIFERRKRTEGHAAFSSRIVTFVLVLCGMKCDSRVDFRRWSSAATRSIFSCLPACKDLDESWKPRACV